MKMVSFISIEKWETKRLGERQTEVGGGVMSKMFGTTAVR
jgi:hypothetical protein